MISGDIIIGFGRWKSIFKKNSSFQLRIKIIYKIFDHFFLYFLSNFKIFLFGTIPKIKKIWQLYKPEKNFPQKSIYL